MTAQAMMRVKFKRPRDLNKQGRIAREQLKSFVSARIIMGLKDMQRYILETPVYSGRTMVNFRWSAQAPVTSTRAAISTPPLPGKTSDLPLGSEPRRAANAAVVQEEFNALLLVVMENPFQEFYLNNNLEHFSDVEYGVYARAGHTSRTPPGGMTRRGEIGIEYALMGIGKRVA